MGKRVLVCGGRDYSDRECVYGTLDGIDIVDGIDVIIQGDARGADRLGKLWAFANDRVKLESYPAQWDKHGRSAGPIRNAQMLKEGKPDLVVAFPGGRGTAHMVGIARKAHAFETLGAYRVELRCDGRNARSRAAIAKLGALEEGVLRRHMQVQPAFLKA